MLLSAVCLITGVLALLLVRRHRKLKSLVGLYGPPPSSYLAGHFKHMFGLHGIDFQLEVLRKYGPTVGMTGVMGEPFILTFDPGFIHTVLVRERSKFERNEGGTLMVRSMFGGGLLGFREMPYSCLTQFLRYNIFANVSSNISLPSLSTDTSLTVLPVFTDVAKQACRAIDQSLSTEVNDVFQWSTAAALEFIGEAGLGYSFGSFSGETNEYSVASKSVFQLFAKLVPFIPLYPYLYRLPITPRYYHITIRLSKFSGNGKISSNEASTWNHSVIARILDVVAHDTNIQDKMREELLENKDKDTLELPYLDAGRQRNAEIISSGYVPGSSVSHFTVLYYLHCLHTHQRCEEDTVVPLIYPISTPSGTTTNLPVKKGTRLALSVVFSNRDESVWGSEQANFGPSDGSKRSSSRHTLICKEFILP
ncbi:cytochrome p450, partial [Rhizoctonia solani]